MHKEYLDATNYMVMSRDQNVGRSHNKKIDNSSSERMEHFIYLGTNLTYQNYIQETIKSISKSRNACRHLLQNLLSCSLLSKNLKVKITVIFPVRFV